MAWYNCQCCSDFAHRVGETHEPTSGLLLLIRWLMAANFVCAELILSNSMLPLIRMSLFSHTFMVGAYYTSFLFQQQVSLVDLNLCASALHRFFFTQASHKKRNQLSDSWAEGRQKLPQQEIRYPKKQKTSKVPRCGISFKKKKTTSPRRSFETGAPFRCWV